MNGLRRICAVIFLIVAASTLNGQSVSGSTTVDIDPETSMVTATCETDVDWASQGYYEPTVVCQLTDGAGNVLASGQDFDNSNDVTAVVVLQVQGVPGTNYIATGQHLALLSVPTDDPEGDPCGFCQIDEYNFQEISNEFFNGGIPYAYPVTFYGPGPEEETPAHVIEIANTFGNLIFPNVPDHLSVVTDTAATLNCPNGTTLQRQVNYNVLDINQAIISRTISIMETAYPPLVSSCTGVQADTSFPCQPISSGNFTDVFSAGCPGTPQLATGCGFTIPNQTWNWCSTIAPGSIGHIGQDLVYNNIISVGGNSAPMTPGTTFPK